MTQETPHPTFLYARPERIHAWQVADTGRIVVLVPRFGDDWFGRWLMSKMARPEFRLKLDDIGSFVWQKCTGESNIAEIAQALSEQFGERVDPVYERLGLFFRSLEKTKAIRWQL